MAEHNTTAPPKTAQAASTETVLLGLIRALGSEMQLREAVLHNLSPDTTIEGDLGLDSLTRMELFGRIERQFGLRLSTEAMANVVTLADLRDQIDAAKASPDHKLVKQVSQLQLDVAQASPLACETLCEVLEWHVRVHPNRPHIQLFQETGEGELLSFRDLYQGAATVAAGLQQRGLSHGDTVAIMLPTDKDYFFTFFGVLLAGGVPVSLYPPTRLSQVEDHMRRHQSILNNCGAAVLITFKEVKQLARLLKTQVATLIHIVSIEEFSAAADTDFPRLRGEDIAFLQYTSGSTGTPKGVVLTHANLLANIRAMIEALKANSQDVMVSWLPLYHDMGLIGSWLGSLYCSCLFVVMSPMDFLARPERWLWAIHRYRGTMSPAPNFAYELCLKRIAPEQSAGLDLSSWRAALNGAEAVSSHTLHRFIDRYSEFGFQPQSFMPVYGLAENSVGLAFPPLNRGPLVDRIARDVFTKSGRAVVAPADDANPLEFVGCGKPLQGHEIRIIDELGREVPERQEGRLQFRGPSATRGYYHNPKQTKKLFDGSWLNSGDRAYAVGGDIFITGRSKDIIIHGGRNLYPEELEERVGDIDGVRKGCVAVFGARDTKTATEKLVVLAETRLKDSKAREQLRSQINTQATDIIGMPPDDVVLAPPHSVLKTSSGKVRRSASRDAYEHGTLGPQQRSLAHQVARLLVSAVIPELRRLRRVIGSSLYATWFWCIVAVFAPFVWLSVVLTPRAQSRWHLMRGWGRVLTTLTGITLKLRGAENLPPPGAPCVFVANHSSYLDPFVLIACLPRRFGFVAKGELRNSRLVRTLLDRSGVEYVDRFDRQQSVADAERLVERARGGKSLFFFPEGTFTRVSGIYPFHMGAFITATEAGLPVVPVSMHGTRTVLYPDSWFPRRGTVTITIDRPLSVDKPGPAQTEQSVWEQAVSLRDRSRASILQHSGDPDLSRERPPIW